MNNNENTSEPAVDFALIYEYFSSLHRLGPGSDAATLRALSFLPELSETARIADLGCGAGASTLLLARHTQARITAIDLSPEFIERLRHEADTLGVSPKIDTMICSMDALPFANETLDAIWSEGAIYNIGFEHGLRAWKNYLKTGGHIAVTEASWLTDHPSQEAESFWQEAYPDMKTIDRNISLMNRCGYQMVAAFVLPEECWTVNYYNPQYEVQRSFLASHKENPTAQTFIADQRKEGELYKRYGHQYGYVFYIGKKIKSETVGKVE